MLDKMIGNRSLPQGPAAADDSFLESEWMGAVSPLAGNTVTEITRAAPNELSVLRQGPLGFTAVELVLLADWACHANTGPIHSPPSAGSAAPFPAHP